jgi:oxygen-dependent protoporphyrinogen oxidase
MSAMERAPQSIDVLIIGAGLSGLTAAYTAHQRDFRTMILEAGSRAGGLVQSIRQDGFLLESGPHTFPSTAHELLQLCTALKLTPKAADSKAKKRYLYLHDKLTALPTHPLQAITTPLLSPAGKLRALLEPFQSQTKKSDISLAEFFTHRVGNEVTQHLLDPFISGIYAGDIRALSLPAVFPKLWDWEQSGGSLFNGMRQAKRQQKVPHHATEYSVENNDTHTRSSEALQPVDLEALRSKTPPKKPRMQLLSFENGLQTLTDALVQALPEKALHLNTPVIRLEKTPQGYLAYTAHGDCMAALHLVLAVPADVASRLLQPLSEKASQALADIPYNGIATVQMGFDEKSIPHALDGFGFLVPRREQVSLLGTIWASSLFPERAPIGQVLLSSFIGGAHHAEVPMWEPERIAAEVLKNLAQVFQIATPQSHTHHPVEKPLIQPTLTRVERYERAIPQYTLGHRERIRTVEHALQSLPNLTLCGNYLHGIALNECVKSGRDAAPTAH